MPETVASASLLFFVTASLLLIVAPGPDILFLITQGVTGGRAAGLSTALGLAAGNLVHTLAAALGVSVIFRTSALAFAALKVAGVAYLLYLAWQALRHRGQLLRLENGAAAGSGLSLFRRGLLMNILNPKVALFFLAFLPQFAAPEAGPVWLQMVGLGALFTVLVVLVFGTIGLTAGSLAGWIRRGTGARANRWAAWGVAGVFAALAVRLALVER